ncbi:UbiD family decarboxylase [Paenibacillus sp. EC2-1]|uniref:UbiD family decarboxylase n=1 Tax=Paenibacillus sp. EC2-1 TaxID=3388665 RepID=UPI003BEF3EE3
MKVSLEHDRKLPEVHSVCDLKTALLFLNQQGEGPERIAAPVEAQYELAAHYAVHGGGVPIAPPTGPGLPVLYERVIPMNRPVLVGMFGTRRRCALLLGANEQHIADYLLGAVERPVEPVRCSHPPCQTVVHQEVDLFQLPIPTMSPKDAGPFITLGLVIAKHPVTGESNISIHRLWVKSQDELTIWMVPGRHLEGFYRASKELGKPLPISINIGLDPAVYFASCCTGAIAPQGCNELSIAGGLRNRPVQISSCLSVSADCLADAEYVLEGEITHDYAPEGESGGHSLPEFLGYDGKAHPGLPIVKIHGITSSETPIFQTVIGPGYEQSNLLAIGMEAEVLRFVRDRITPLMTNAYCSSAGGGQLLMFAQFHKMNEQDDAIVRQAGIEIIRSFRMIKQVVLVDEDVNLFSEEEVWWAMATRFQADKDVLILTGLPGFHLDPSQQPGMSPSIKEPGMTAKVVFDCTVPFQLKSHFVRASFSKPPKR